MSRFQKTISALLRKPQQQTRVGKTQDMSTVRELQHKVAAIPFWFHSIDRAQKPWIVPIPGTTKLHRMKENNGAVEVELTADDLREIDDATSQITVQGARYPESMQRLVGR